MCYSIRVDTAMVRLILEKKVYEKSLVLNFGYQDTVTRRYDDFIKALKMHALLLL